VTETCLTAGPVFGRKWDQEYRAGQAYHRPAGIEHDVMNGADRPMAFVEIEFKRPQALVFA